MSDPVGDFRGDGVGDGCEGLSEMLTGIRAKCDRRGVLVVGKHAREIDPNLRILRMLLGE